MGGNVVHVVRQDDTDHPFRLLVRIRETYFGAETMADWTGIANNMRQHGQFAGRSGTDEDAYFIFFAGSDRPATGFVRAALSRALAVASRLENGRGLRWMPFGLASPGGMDRDQECQSKYR